MVAAFDELGVTQAQLERKANAKRGQWTAGTVAELTLAFESIRRDGLAVEEVFGDKPVTAAELTAGEPAADWPPVKQPGGAE